MAVPSVLRVEILSGHASPWVGEFAKPEVLVGRGVGCEVRLHPTQDTLCASGVHLKLVWSEEETQVICEHANGATVYWHSGSGKFLEKGERVSVQGRFEVEVARNGPRIGIQRVAAVLPGTLKADSPEAKKKKFQPVGRVGGETVAAARTGRRLGVAVLALLLVACGGGGVWAWRHEAALTELRRERNAEVDRISAEQSTLRREVEKRPPGDGLRTALSGAAGSVFLVGVERTGEGFEPVGTAWTAAPGKLATNAHVARALETARKGGGRAMARRSGGAADGLEVTSVDIHPAFDRWTEILSQQAVRLGAGESGANLIAIGDVALLGVAGGNTGEGLRLAEPNESIPIGAPVGYVGFPMEGIAGLPTRQTITGTVTAVTDTFFEEARGAEGLLVHVSVLGAGGASGSPIIDERGRVIAMLSAGSMVATGSGDGAARVSAGLNYGQSVMLVREMLDSSAEAAQKGRDAAWREAMAKRFVTPEERLDARLREFERTLKAKAESVSDDVVVVPPNGQSPPRSLSLEAGYHYLVLAADADWNPLTLAVGEGGKAEAWARSERAVVAVVLKKGDKVRTMDVALRTARPAGSEAKVRLRVARIRD